MDLENKTKDNEVAFCMVPVDQKTVTYDPTKSKFFDVIQTNPVDYNKKHSAIHKRKCDVRMGPEELDVFRRVGFVVSQRSAFESYGDAYFQAYSDHLPVFITADSVLHAWYKTMDYVLKDVEEKILSKNLEKVLRFVYDKIPDLKSRFENNIFMTQCLQDLDIYITVALNLLTSGLVKEDLDYHIDGMCEGNLRYFMKYEYKPPQRDEKIQSHFANNDATVVDMIKEIRVHQKLKEKYIFGEFRFVDFSLFKVRGAYVKTLDLRRYFQASMWCGTIDWRLCPGPKDNPVDSSAREWPVQTGSALILAWLISDNRDWIQMDSILQKLVGVSDSMTVAQLWKTCNEFRILTLGEVSNPVSVNEFRGKLASRPDIPGQQKINGHSFMSPNGLKTPVQIPRTMTLCGQKFVIDSWVLSQLVFDKLIDSEGEKVNRRIPSALDIGSCIFGNMEASRFLADRMKRRPDDPGFVKFRDGLDYAKGLDGAKDIVEALPDSEWNKSVYSRWLNVLASLSSYGSETSWFNIPETFRTEAWGQRNLNTQFGSWTQLRHNSVLYAKQSVSCYGECKFAAGYVEPCQNFWRLFLEMVRFTHETISSVDPNNMAAYHIQKTWIPILERLGSISVKQAQNIPLSHDDGMTTVAPKHNQKPKPKPKPRAWSVNLKDMSDTEFIQSTIEIMMGSGSPQYLGWYPALFPEEGSDCSLTEEGIVTDTHTDIPDLESGDPGAILHEGVHSKVNTMIISVPGIGGIGPGTCYVGPVYRHHEFLRDIDQRMTDGEWKTMCSSGKDIPYGEWTDSWLVKN